MDQKFEIAYDGYSVKIFDKNGKYFGWILGTNRKCKSYFNAKTYASPEDAVKSAKVYAAKHPGFTYKILHQTTKISPVISF